MTPSVALRTACLDPTAQADMLTRQSGLAIEIVRDDAGFLALREDWDALFARSALPHQLFQSHVFLRHWATHYREPGARLSIVTARRDGRLVMVWPLQSQRRFGLQMLCFMGLPVAQFGDVLVERDGHEATLLAAGWSAVRSLRADLFELRRVRSDAALNFTSEPPGSVLMERREAPRVDLDLRVGPDGPSSIYPARERSNYRRRLRRLGEHGSIGFATLGPGPEAARLAGEAIAMKQAALTRHGVLAPTVSDPRFAAFFRDLAGDTQGGSPLRMTAISCNGSAIGIDIAFDCKRTSFGHVIATHPDHERGGVGSVLIHRSFDAAKARGNTHFDLLAPADPYKLEHSDEVTGVEDRLMPLSLAGQLVCRMGRASAPDAARDAAKPAGPGDAAPRSLVATGQKLSAQPISASIARAIRTSSSVRPPASCVASVTSTVR